MDLPFLRPMDIDPLGPSGRARWASFLSSLGAIDKRNNNFVSGFDNLARSRWEAILMPIFFFPNYVTRLTFHLTWLMQIGLTDFVDYSSTSALGLFNKLQNNPNWTCYNEIKNSKIHVDLTRNMPIH